MDLDGSVIAGVVAAGILAFVWYSSQSQPQKPTKKSRNSAKKIVEKAQVTIPGQFEPRDPLATITVGGSEGKKKKKNKGKGKAVDNGPGSSLTKYTPPATTTATTTTTPAPTTPAATTAPAPAPAPVPATDGNDTDSSWTHLERSQTTSQRPYAERVLSKSVRKTGVERSVHAPDISFLLIGVVCSPHQIIHQLNGLCALCLLTLQRALQVGVSCPPELQGVGYRLLSGCVRSAVLL